MVTTKKEIKKLEKQAANDRQAREVAGDEESTLSDEVDMADGLNPHMVFAHQHTDETGLPMVSSSDDEEDADREEEKLDVVLKTAGVIHYEATEISANAQVSLFPVRRDSFDNEASVISESRDRDIIGDEVEEEPIREGSVQLP